MIIRPAHSYPCTYKGSSSEIEFVCDDHQERMICGSARRTGLTVVEGYPVYALHSFVHPKYNDILVALSPDGFLLRPVYTIREQEPKPNRTPFIACVLEDSKAPYDFDPHPIAWWMYTKGDLVQAVNKQVSGIRYVTPERFQVCCVLAGVPSAQMPVQQILLAREVESTGPLDGDSHLTPWCGLDWTSWTPLASGRLPEEGLGLYRLRVVELWPIAARLKEYRSKIPLECSWVAGNWSHHRRLELKSNAIGAHLLTLSAVPLWQFEKDAPLSGPAGRSVAA